MQPFTPILAHGSYGLVIVMIGVVIVVNVAGLAGVVLSFTQMRGSGKQLMFAASSTAFGLLSVVDLRSRNEPWTWWEALCFAPSLLGLVGLLCWVHLKRRNRGDVELRNDDR